MWMLIVRPRLKLCYVLTSPLDTLTFLLDTLTSASGFLAHVDQEIQKANKFNCVASVGALARFSAVKSLDTGQTNLLPCICVCADLTNDQSLPMPKP